MSERKSTKHHIGCPLGKFCGEMFLLVRHSQVFFVQGLELELPVERDDCADVLDGFRRDLLEDTRCIQDLRDLKVYPNPGRFKSDRTEKLEFDLSCCLQLLLVFGSVSSQDLDVSGSSKGDDGHDGQDEQRQLPAVDKGDDDADTDVGEVLHQRRQTSAGSLVRDTNIDNICTTDPAGKEPESLARLRIDSWTHPLNLSRVCGQSGRQCSNAVFGIVKPAEILWQKYVRFLHIV